MSIYIIKPTLTDSLVLCVFQYLCTTEVKRRVGISPVWSEGAQDGYGMCLSHMLGESDQKTLERAFDDGKTYLHVMERIIDNKLSEFIENMKNDKSKDQIEKMKTVNSVVKGAVRDYYAEKPNELREAIKLI